LIFPSHVPALSLRNVTNHVYPLWPSGPVLLTDIDPIGTMKFEDASR
jgi:hypothetical protein